MNSALMSQINNPLMMATDKLGNQLQGRAAQFSNSAFSNDKGLSDYNDLNALQSLKHRSKSDKDGALDAAAKHFESIFVSMMIKSMRDANKVFSEGNLLQSNQSDFYQQMFDSQMAVSLSTGKGIGLAEVIKRQLSKGVGPTEAGQDTFALSSERRAYSLEDYARQPFVSAEKVEKIEEAIETIDQAITQFKAPAEPKAEIDFSSPSKFIESLYPYAKQAEQDTGIDARLMLAQSALETGWGKREILNADGSSSHNLFGIKAHASWAGESTNITTTEYRNGLAMKERANFRSYDSYQESFTDYGRFLNSNIRYEKALEKADLPHEFAKELQDAGYATDPEYADKINRIIDRYMNIDDLSALEESIQSRNIGMGG